MTIKIVTRCGLLLLVALLISFSAMASTITCPSATGSVAYGNPASPSFTCGDLTFSNFEVPSVSGGASGVVDILGASYNTVSGEVDLSLNPNMQASQDVLFGFEVTGGVNQLDLALGGVDAEITETACSAPIPLTGPLADLCPAGTLLGTVSATSNEPSAPVFSNPFLLTSPIYVLKDILTGYGIDGSAGGLSYMDQSFEVQNLGHGQAPEPASLVLMGAGLLGLGLMKRRRKA